MYFTVLTKKKLLIFLSIIIAIIIALISIISIGVSGAFNGKKKKLPIYSVEREDKKISISFDCAWGVDYTDKLLATMQEENVRCTFFMVEFWAKAHPDYVKKIYEMGHEIGTHSATHPYMSKLDKNAVVKELSSSCQVIENITGKKVEVFRPPYGDYNDNLIETASELNLYTIQWDVDSLDWKNLSSNQIQERVLSKVKNGSIVLFHNQGLHTAQALPKIIKTLKNKGYEIVPIGELIYRDNYEMLADGTQRLKQTL
jgi:polysaccharide deacetylase family sporulation protein PdaB